MKKTAGELLTYGRDAGRVWTVHGSATVRDALMEMHDREVGAVPIVGPGDRFVGMYSERDYARSVAGGDPDLLDTNVGRVARRRRVMVTPDEPMERCLELMEAENTRHVPVVQDGRLVGVVTIGDVLRALLEHARQDIALLEGYIQGDRFSAMPTRPRSAM